MRSLLHAQQVDDVDLRAARASRSWLTVTGQPSSDGGSSVGGATSVTSAPRAVNASDVGAGDAAVLDVADDGDARPASAAEALADRVAVEQRLGRVLVPAVAGVDHRRRRPARDLPGTPADCGARRWRRRPSPRSSGRCRGATRPSSPTTCRPRRSWCRPTAAWPRSRTTAGCGSSPRRRSDTTVLPRSAGTSGCRGG